MNEIIFEWARGESLQEVGIERCIILGGNYPSRINYINYIILAKATRRIYIIPNSYVWKL